MIICDNSALIMSTVLICDNHSLTLLSNIIYDTQLLIPPVSVIHTNFLITIISYELSLGISIIRIHLNP